LLPMLVTARLAIAAVLVAAVGPFPIGRSVEGRPTARRRQTAPGIGVQAASTGTFPGTTN